MLACDQKQIVAVSLGIFVINGPETAKRALMSYANSESPDQHVHVRSLIRPSVPLFVDVFNSMQCFCK